MTMLEAAPLLLVILCNIGYHLISKNISNGINPFLGLVGTYGVACFVSACLFMVTKNTIFQNNKSGISIYNILMGIVIIGVEGGYMLMYRAGWEISKASLMANICLAVVLMFVGVFFYKEGIDLRKIAGIALCIIGIVLLKR